MTSSNNPNPEQDDELRECEQFLRKLHENKMGNYAGDPWQEHPYQDATKPYFFEDDAKVLLAWRNAYAEKKVVELGCSIVSEIDKLRNAPAKGRKNPDDYWNGFSDLAFHLDEFIGKELATLSPKAEKESKE